MERQGEQPRELAFARTENGIELPVLDITHPLFATVGDERQLADLQRRSAASLKAMATMTDDQKRVYREQLSRSLIFGPIFVTDPNANYLSGMSTYVYKLGPDLIGGGEERQFDRGVCQSIGGVALRLRLADLCRLQAGLLIPQLRSFAGKDLCFVSIAGGAASDSLNTLLLILREDPRLLSRRRIQINVLDVDTLSPRFAERCVDALTQPAHPFHGFDVTVTLNHYDWRDAAALIELLRGKEQCILLCTSEGGLFEYGADDDIRRNLEALHDHTPDEASVAGTFIHEIDKVDPTVPAMAKAAGAGLRFLGTRGLTTLLAGTGWRFDSVREENPIYGVFVLRKE